MARIKIDGINKGTYSDSLGNFNIQGLRAGTYTIICVVDDLGSDTLRNVSVKENESTSITFQLKLLGLGKPLTTVKPAWCIRLIAGQMGPLLRF